MSAWFRWCIGLRSRRREVSQTRVHENIRWFPVDELPELAFDHNEIVEYALYRLQNKVEYSRICALILGR